ncbi:MAG: sugar transferase [Blastocatellia bacterium]
MTRSIRTSVVLLHRLLDLFVLGASFALAVALTSPGSMTAVSQAALRGETHVFVSLGILLISWSAGLSALWRRRAPGPQRRQAELGAAFRAVGLCTLILSTAELALEWQTVNKWTLLMFFLVATALLFLARVAPRSAPWLLRAAVRDPRRVVIVGTGERAQELARMIGARPELGYVLTGFIDHVAAPGVIGSPDRIAEILCDNVVDEMMIALPFKTFYEEMEQIVRVAAEQGVVVRVHSGLFSVGMMRAVAEQFDETPTVTLYTGPDGGRGLIAKRVIDFVVALALLALLSPLLLLLVMLIRLTSRGPALFVQERLGHNKRPFRMYKFRTMAADAPARQEALEHLNEADGPVFKIKNDPRVTALGRWLRRASLDELPQLLNVLRGDLSLVGPRPLPRRDFERFDAYWFNRRFSVKPGMTCLWQISGRSDASFEQWIRQDLEYIDNWSLALDLRILLLTIPAVVRGTGAM